MGENLSTHRNGLLRMDFDPWRTWGKTCQLTGTVCYEWTSIRGAHGGKLVNSQERSATNGLRSVAHMGENLSTHRNGLLRMDFDPWRKWRKLEGQQRLRRKARQNKQTTRNFYGH